MKKRLTIIACLTLCIWGMGYYLLGPYDYYCYRCGAKKTRYTVSETDVSRIVRNIRGIDCDHFWILHSSGMGFADAFAYLEIPLWQYGTANALALIPIKAWQQELLSSLTDDENKLRWCIPTILEAFVWVKNTPNTKRDWEKWRQEFDPMFTSEYDLKKAREKAQLLSDAFTRHFDMEPILKFPISDAFASQFRNYEMKLRLNIPDEYIEP